MAGSDQQDSAEMIEVSRAWKIQLPDENHLLIKYTSESVVTLRVTDPSQASFFVYNVVTTEVTAV